MKQFLDYIPLVFFFIVYKMEERVVVLGNLEYTLGGIFSATEILVVASILVYGALYLSQRHLERSQVITLGAVLVFCSFTLLFREEAILKWKAPVVNWIFAAVFIGSHYLTRTNAARMMMEHAIQLPDPVWTRLNLGWGVFFLVLGATNLFVAFTFHDYWVDFKVFGSMGMIFLFIIGQTIYLSRHMQSTEEEEEKAEETSPPKSL
jgi:intracellular septation protein